MDTRPFSTRIWSSGRGLRGIGGTWVDAEMRVAASVSRRDLPPIEKIDRIRLQDVEAVCAGLLERALQDFDTALDSARDIATQARGIVRLASLPSFAASVLPDAILRFRDKRPNVIFNLRDVIAGQVLSLVESDQVDFGVMGGKIKAAGVETVFEAQDRLHVVYPKGHRISRLKAIAPLALSEFPLILMHRDTSVRAVVQVFNPQALSPRRPAK